MKKELVDRIYSKLLRVDWTKLTYSLKEGLIGISLFLALYSEVRRNKRARDLSTGILVQALKRVNSFSESLLHGRLGVYWVLNYLSNKNILQKSQEVEQHVAIGIAECMALRSSTPIQIIHEDRLFSTGIYMLQYHTVKETLEHFAQYERLLLLLDESERMLTQTIKDIYTPHKMPLRTLHSIQFFLSELEKNHVCPFVVQHLLAYIPTLYKELRKDIPVDEYILHSLLCDNIPELPKALSKKELVDFIGTLGFYSVLYDNPFLFRTAWEKITLINPDFVANLGRQIEKDIHTINELCGLGYGLLNEMAIGTNRTLKMEKI